MYDWSIVMETVKAKTTLKTTLKSFGQFFLRQQLLYVLRQSHGRCHCFKRITWMVTLFILQKCGKTVVFLLLFPPFVRNSCLLLTPNSFAGAHNFAAFATQYQFVKHHFTQPLLLALPFLWNSRTRKMTGMLCSDFPFSRCSDWQWNWGEGNILFIWCSEHKIIG